MFYPPLEPDGVRLGPEGLPGPGSGARTLDVTRAFSRGLAPVALGRRSRARASIGSVNVRSGSGHGGCPRGSGCT